MSHTWTDARRRILVVILVVLACMGTYLRFIRITENTFFYYDEGLYLNHNIKFLRAVHQSPPQNFTQLKRFIELAFHLALREPKSLWFFLCYLRTVILQPDAWYYTRVLSVIFGSLTIPLVFFFTKRFYQSSFIAVVATCLFALLPSHVYYSRLGMQEALSTFLFMAGMSLYIFFAGQVLEGDPGGDLFCRGLLHELPFYHYSIYFIYHREFIGLYEKR